MLADLGAFIIDTDELAREALAPGSDGFAAVARRWPQVVHGDTLDRLALAKIVFADPDARAALNDLVHPFVRRVAREREAQAQPGQLIVHVVPLLFETGYRALVDKAVLVVAPDTERIARVTARDDVDEAHVRARMSAQIVPQEARRHADYVIENDGDLAHLREQTRKVYAALVVG